MSHNDPRWEKRFADGFALEFTLDMKWQPNTVPKLFNNNYLGMSKNASIIMIITIIIIMKPFYYN